MSLGVLICVSSASRTATRAMRNAQTYPNDTSRADQCSDLISPACRVRCDSWKDTALRPSRLARLLAVLLRAELTHTPCATQSHCLTNAASAASAHATVWFATTAAPAQTSHRRLRLRLHPQRRRSDHHLRRAMRCRLYSATPTHLERRFPHVLGALEAVGVPQARRETVLDFHLIFLVKVAAVACAPVLLPKSPPPPCHMVSAASSVANSPRAKIPHGGWRASSGCGG